MSKIEWTDRTWNPTTGCNKVSQGCKNCYALVMHRRQQHMNPHKYTKGFTEGVEVHVSELEKPHHWKTPSRIFVNSMSDLFHDDVPFEFIIKVFSIIRFTPRHTYQILTKRIQRALAFYKWVQLQASILDGREPWPLPNVWIGTSCEDQETANERIPYLLQIPAAVRFLSCEPLLGPINFLWPEFIHMKAITYEKPASIHWVITGGESGHGARPVHPDWVRSLRDQCKAANVPFFFKQWGEYMPIHIDFRNSKPVKVKENGKLNYETFFKDESGKIFEVLQSDGDYLAAGEWHESYAAVSKVGKSKSGNFLDGVQHLEFPKA